MTDLLDSHTHTLASGHAYSTIHEMITAAEKKKLSLLAITEHAPEMPGSCHRIYFDNLRVIPRKYGDITVLFGAELNILNRKGEIDLPEKTLEQLDVVIASIHPPCYSENNSEAHMEAYLNVMKNPYVNIIGHPDDGRYPLDYEILVKAAREHHKLLEVNSSSLAPTSYRVNARENYVEMLEYCRKYEVPVVIDSDAHIDQAVGEHSLAWELIMEMAFPERLIANTDLDLYDSFVHFRDCRAF